jgi:hypothetical protein
MIKYDHMMQVIYQEVNLISWARAALQVQTLGTAARPVQRSIQVVSQNERQWAHV